MLTKMQFQFNIELQNEFQLTDKAAVAHTGRVVLNPKLTPKTGFMILCNV